MHRVPRWRARRRGSLGERSGGEEPERAEQPVRPEGSHLPRQAGAPSARDGCASTEGRRRADGSIRISAQPKAEPSRNGLPVLHGVWCMLMRHLGVNELSDRIRCTQQLCARVRRAT